MVSSKCCQVESPSPFRFLAALMPPCAHTECERFTGTIENRSTSPPISAILMTAASPARPPPTTIIFGVAAIYISPIGRPSDPLSHYDIVGRSIRLPRMIRSLQETVHAGRPDCDQSDCQCQANIAETTASVFTGGDAPFRCEQP